MFLTTAAYHTVTYNACATQNIMMRYQHVCQDSGCRPVQNAARAHLTSAAAYHIHMESGRTSQKPLHSYR